MLRFPGEYLAGGAGLFQKRRGNRISKARYPNAGHESPLRFGPAHQTRARLREFNGKTDAKGEVWVIIGTDSGYEAETTLYYTSIKATFSETK